MLRQFRQFFLDGAPLEKEADPARLQKSLGNLDELRKRREGASRHHIGRRRFRAVESREMDRGWGAGHPHSFTQESCFPSVGIDEMTIWYAKNAEDKSR
jgi:hypothetical protein